MFRQRLRQSKERSVVQIHGAYTALGGAQLRSLDMCGRAGQASARTQPLNHSANPACSTDLNKHVNSTAQYVLNRRQTARAVTRCGTVVAGRPRVGRRLESMLHRQ
jgi:hypothetical protein